MDSELKKQIRAQYIREYTDKYNQEHHPFFSGLVKSPLAFVLTSLTTSAIVIASFIATKGLIIIPLVAGGIYAVNGAGKEKKEIENLVARDIENGTLVTRYQKDVLEPQLRLAKGFLAAAEEKIVELEGVKKSSEDFSAAAQKNNPAANDKKDPPKNSGGGLRI